MYDAITCIKFTGTVSPHTEVIYTAVLVWLQHEAIWLQTGHLELLSNRTVQHNPETVSLQLLKSTNKVVYPSWAWSNVLSIPTLGSSGWCISDQVSYAEACLYHANLWNLCNHSVHSCWYHCRNYLELWKATQTWNCGCSCVLFIVYIIALGLFEANAIQFGLDQLLEDPTTKLISFIHWYYWNQNVAGLILYYTASLATYYKASLGINNTQIQFLNGHLDHLLVIVGFVTMLIINTALLIWYLVSKKHFYIQRAVSTRR